MSDSIHCVFVPEAKDYKKIYDFKTSITVRQIIENYLRDTNSIMDYKIDSITFMSNSQVLNKDDNLDKPLSEVIKKSVLRTGTIKIKVFETIDILGGISNIKKNRIFVNKIN